MFIQRSIRAGLTRPPHKAKADYRAQYRDTATQCSMDGRRSATGHLRHSTGYRTENGTEAARVVSGPEACDQGPVIYTARLETRPSFAPAAGIRRALFKLLLPRQLPDIQLRLRRSTRRFLGIKPDHGRMQFPPVRWRRSLTIGAFNQFRMSAEQAARGATCAPAGGFTQRLIQVMA